jgi:hypothetical protein
MQQVGATVSKVHSSARALGRILEHRQRRSPTRQNIRRTEAASRPYITSRRGRRRGEPARQIERAVGGRHDYGARLRRDHTVSLWDCKAGGTRKSKDVSFTGSGEGGPKWSNSTFRSKDAQKSLCAIPNHTASLFKSPHRSIAHPCRVDDIRNF